MRSIMNQGMKFDKIIIELRLKEDEVIELERSMLKTKPSNNLYRGILLKKWSLDVLTSYTKTWESLQAIDEFLDKISDRKVKIRVSVHRPGASVATLVYEMKLKELAEKLQLALGITRHELKYAPITQEMFVILVNILRNYTQGRPIELTSVELKAVLEGRVFRYVIGDKLPLI